MKIITLPIGQLRANCYLIIDQESKNCLIIDPGDEANFIAEKIIQEKLKPSAIIATHGHFDHTLAAKELQINFDIPFLINKRDQKILNSITRSANWWLKQKIVEVPPKINKFLEEGDKISFGKEYLKVTETPGHTSGGVCFYNSPAKILFSGDTIFKDGVGRTDFSYSSTPNLKNSLKKIKQQFKGFLIYPGHGPEFYL